jgi:flagellar hook-associated protein 2
MSSLSPAQVGAQAAAQAAQAVKDAAQSLISTVTGSSLDVSSLVSALVKAKTAGPAAELQGQATSDSTEIGALATLSASMSGLQSALAPFLNGNALSSFTTTLSGEGISARTVQGATAGTFQIDTAQAAQAQSITSSTFSSGDANAMGTGTIDISLGSSGAKSFQINIDSSNDSLQDIANAINSASGNPGIKATVVNGANGQSITLQATATGATNTISIGVTGATSGSALVNLAVTTAPGTDSSGASTITAGSSNWTQSTAAQNAQLTINNTLVTSLTNTISNAIPGVTLTIDPGNAKALGKQTLTVSADNSSVETDLSAFVTAYNAVIDQMNSLAAPNSSNMSGGGGVLLGDEMLNQIGAALGGIADGKVSSGAMQGTLASLGITFQTDTGGNPFAELLIDADPNGPTLDDVVANNPGIVSTLFNDTNGIAQQLDSALTAYTSMNGIIATRSDALTDDIKSLGKQQDDLSDFSMQLTSQFNDQFTALNNIMAQAQSNENFLTALFGGNNSNGALAQNGK